ncbi:hypothetical protein HMPREF1219_01501 [Corynebacterium pyruviciproducens ATCC BAA-1742]|uniref:RelE/StbE family addiction module toxin n=1 Tax=Corynebacterium pyruviciproducens ATCC BAA-1742 TaxID=1125779 RepID=S2YYD4_9CORY|nr:type II toxin-antitoxin system RelE/ParE family toxin [Corynebacterium pyruviciproducens]EPD69276.1 hypothetical protein HMPREF1219_01501 [Corynebacterium pyruviciproducens ATCC BAA-1742]MDK7214731.1 type II toxin-antitoxin system RelE/ParE family toxin [Corynebacterium pyruviciproducens]
MAVTKREFYDLEKEGQAALAVQLKQLERAEITTREMRSLGDGVYEIRASVRGNQYRIALFQDSPVHYIILACFFKNQNRAMNEVKKAKKRAKEWRAAKPG